jgi:hypothetical protein
MLSNGKTLGHSEVEKAQAEFKRISKELKAKK